MWYWFDTSSNTWLALEESKSNEIEEEYDRHLSRNRMGQRVYHCFGNKWSAAIDFDKMETYCASGRCLLTHEKNRLSDNHMTYKLKREV